MHCYTSSVPVSEATVPSIWRKREVSETQTRTGKDSRVVCGSHGGIILRIVKLVTYEHSSITQSTVCLQNVEYQVRLGAQPGSCISCLWLEGERRWVRWRGGNLGRITTSSKTKTTQCPSSLSYLSDIPSPGLCPPTRRRWRWPPARGRTTGWTRSGRKSSLSSRSITRKQKV